MRQVGGGLALGGRQPRKLVGHMVERLARRAQLGGPGGVDARAQIATGRPGDRLREAVGDLDHPDGQPRWKASSRAAGVGARIGQVRAETAAVGTEARRVTETARSQAGEALAAVDAQHRRADDAEAMSAELRGGLDELSAEHGRPPGRPTNA